MGPSENAKSLKSMGGANHRIPLGGTRGTPLKKGSLKIDQQGLGDLWLESVGEQDLKPGEGGWQVMSPLRLENGRKGQEEREPEITIYPKSK